MAALYKHLVNYLISPTPRAITTVKILGAYSMMAKSRIVTEITRKHRSTMPPRPVRICAYVRVSTGHEGQQNSFQSQTEYYEHRFSNDPHYLFTDIFSDSGISGAKENRPGFQAMLEKARTGQLDFIYTKSISRFARNTLMILSVVRELRSIGVGIVFDEQNINTLRSEGELMLTILAGIAEEERKSVRTNVQWALRNKCLRGEVMVNTNRLIGYDKDELGKLIINPAQAKVVRKIFRLYLDGISTYKIAQVLDQLCTPTYTSRPWNSQRILSIISNEKYMGSCLMQKSFVDEIGRQVPNRGQRDQYWIEDDHPAIISRKDWDQAQRIRQSRVRKVYPFSSLLHCAFCGSTMIRVTHAGGWFSWICCRYLRQGKAACVGSRIAEHRLLVLTKNLPITEPVIVEEVCHEQDPKKRSQKDYRFTPVSTDPAKQPKS